MTMPERDPATGRVEAEPWITALREKLVQSGYDRQQVDALIVVALARFRTARVRDFIPLLVERSVRSAVTSD
jgi:hypothetical protein